MTEPEKSRTFDASEWISKSQAAQLRGISRQAIWELVKRKRLTTFVFAGRVYLYRSEVMSFKRRPRGPSTRKKGDKKQKNFDPTKWISKIEAGEIAGVTRQAVSNLIQRHRLRTMVVDNKTLVMRSTLEKFMAEQRKKKSQSKSGKKK
jgi:predicted DNA-binding protein YlxM (UPF0122 family)